MSTVPDYSCRVSVSGGSAFIREAAVPFAEEMESIFPKAEREQLPDVFPRSPLIFNSAATALLIGATLFVARHLTKKVLDDVYSQLIEPRLKPFLSKLDAKLKNADTRSPKAFNCSIWYDELQVLVSVTLRGDSFGEIAKDLALIPTVHQNALAWIRENGRQKPVHSYFIEKGYATVTPELADNINRTFR